MELTMASGLYASMTPLPFSSNAASIFINVFQNIICLRTQEKRAGTVLDEIYARIGEYIPISSLASENTSSPSSYRPLMFGSSWALQCFKTHEFHYHSYSKDEELLSFRRLLLFSDHGFTAEIYPLDFEKNLPAGPLERFIFKEASLAELEFDGRMVHRFRPLNDGVLFAYSVHSKDLLNTDHAARTQTHQVTSDEPKEVNEYLMYSPEMEQQNVQAINSS